MPDDDPHEVTVIGAGIVGTVCANYLLHERHKVTLIDRNSRAKRLRSAIPVGSARPLSSRLQCRAC
jgi:2-polyprenyl-6-methoxyphenol hydroxylase-like FAD-dependent oxidoreductase